MEWYYEVVQRNNLNLINFPSKKLKSHLSMRGAERQEGGLMRAINVQHLDKRIVITMTLGLSVTVENE